MQLHEKYCTTIHESLRKGVNQLIGELGGVCFSACWDTPPGPGPPGVGLDNPWVWVWTPPGPGGPGHPQGVGLDTPHCLGLDTPLSPSQTPQSPSWVWA